MYFQEQLLVILVIGIVDDTFPRPDFTNFNTSIGTASVNNQPTQLKIQRRSHQPNNDHQRINNANYQQLSYRGPSGSCHDFWSYQQNNGEVWGKLMIVNPHYSQNIVEINLSLDARLQSQYVGKISLVKDNESSFRDAVNGLPLLYRVIFPTQDPLPMLISINLNDRLICSSPRDVAPLTTITLKHNFSAKFTEPKNSALQHFSTPPIYTTKHYKVPASTHLTTHQTTEASTSGQQIQQSLEQRQKNYQSQDYSSVCGTTYEGFGQGLVIGGKRAARGEWPWLVALYRSDKGNLEYFCGATLISNTFVLTAAHCILEKQETEPLRADFILLFMGKYSLLRWNEEGLEKRGARRVIVHPDWDQEQKSFDGDVALIEIDSPVQFSKFVRPICLWNFEIDLSKIVGKIGIVVGWGTTEMGEISNDYPKKVNAPIVTNEQCLRSSDGFIDITSERTFCAGGRRGEGPCRGDSGGGLVLHHGDKWYIRGIVSSSLINNGVCDVNKFAVYTDVAKFMPWVINHIFPN